MRKRHHIVKYSFYGHVTSKPVLDGPLPVHPPSFLVLRECGQGRVIVALVLGCSSQATLTVQPATLRASTLMMRKYIELVMRPPIDVLLLLTAPAALLSLLGPTAHSSDRTSLCDRPAAVARSLTPPVKGAHHEARQKGNLNPAG